MPIRVTRRPARSSRKDARITASRPLTAFCYSIVDADSDVPDTQWETLQYLKALGFQIADDVARRFDTLDEALEYIESFHSRRHDLPYETDGLVIKVARTPSTRTWA